MRGWLATQPDLRDSAVFGETELQEQTGYTGVIDIYALQPSCRYYYALSLDTGARPPASEFHSFRAFPVPGEMQDFRFAFVSGFRPRGSYAGRAFQHMLDHHPALDFLIQQGDQINTDERKHNGPGDAVQTVEDYRQAYLQTWSNPLYREMLRSTPVFMAPGPYEVDSSRQAHDTNHIQRIQAALQAYEEHQGMYAPGLTLPRKSQRGGLRLAESPASGSQAYSFYYGATAFFVLDTRTERISSGEKRVLGEAQGDSLEQWLLAVRDEFPVKFIVSSAGILSETIGDLGNHQQSFRQERDRLLFFLAANAISGVYILAGGLHEGHAISTELHGPESRSIPLWEFGIAGVEQRPNLLAPILKKRPRSPALHNSKIHYSIGKTNYGVVQVSFSEACGPRVRFELHYADRAEWKMRATETEVK
jgi:phosphodiesterase/alkaline phosphatase D-like protein